MSERGLIAITGHDRRDGVAAVLAACRGKASLPTADDLLIGLARGLLCLEGAASALVLVHPRAAGFGSLHNGDAGYLLEAGADTGQHLRLDAEWRKALWTQLGTGPVTRQGSLSGAPQPCRGFRMQEDTIWMTAPVQAGQQPGLAAVVVLNDPATAAVAARGLQDLVQAMSTVLGLWSEAMVLQVQLRQVRDESRTLGRINRLQGRFVAMATHEFKTPLTSITAYADVLAGRITDEQFPQATEFLGVIRQEADRLLRMINRILDFSRMEYGSRLLDLREVDLEPLVRETVRSLGPGIRDKELEVGVHAQRRLARVEIDTDLVRQVLVNLVGNAVKYTPSGGTVDIDLAEEGAMVAVTVADDGPGIPPADMKRIFNEFYRASTEVEGTGLGLTIARHIVHLHGGHITVASHPGGGTAFRFLLPKAARHPHPAPAYLSRFGTRDELEALFTDSLRLLAELTHAPRVALLLRDARGGLATVCAIGLDPVTDEPPVIPLTPHWLDILQSGRIRIGEQDLEEVAGDLDWISGRRSSRMLVPVFRAGRATGALILGRCRGQEPFTPVDGRQVEILAGILSSCLERLQGGLQGPLMAVRSLMMVRRRGIPTATAAALALTGDLADRLGLAETERRAVMDAAVLHDAGMVRLDEDILDESGGLAEDQRDEVERHVSQGLEMLEPLLTSPEAAAIIRHHHERWDGRGYPDGLAGQAIPAGARLLAVLDAWFALTTDRPFRAGLDSALALAEIRAHAGTQFDPRVVRALSLALAPATDDSPDTLTETDPEQE